jgi:hypothetical protein
MNRMGSKIALWMAMGLLAGGCGAFGERDAKCVYERKAVGEQEVTPLGFSLGEVRNRLNGTHLAALTWSNSDPGVLETFPAPAQTELTLTAVPDGEARYLEARREGSNQQRLACMGRAEIDGQVRLATADGGFDDSWPVVFQASAASGSSAEASFGVDLLASPPKGTFRARWKELRPGETQSLRIDGQVGSAGTSGQVNISRMLTRNGTGEGSGTWTARWASP